MSDLDSSMCSFTIQDFQRKKPFSSFLPGIAGLKGIPMWVFYVNRGQGIAGFGVESKDHPLMEFQCAQRAYQNTAQMGFRTFLVGKRNQTVWHYEPFGLQQQSLFQRDLITGLNEFSIEETNSELGLKVKVLYFLLPNAPIGALVRLVTLTNIGSDRLELEGLDGLPVIAPYGINDQTLKNMGRTIEAWMEVVNHENGLPFFRIKASANDELKVEEIKAGNFAFGFEGSKLLPALVDPQAVFGNDTAFTYPEKLKGGLKALLQCSQTTQGRTPCAFIGFQHILEVGQSMELASLYGNASSLDLIQGQVNGLAEPGSIERKLEEARAIAADITNAVQTKSASRIFDDYCRQTYLDNVMRGGAPLIIGGRHVYHTYSRKHGDLERDYNFFVVSPEFYSQGNGNFRDVNQNRRSDVFFNPRAGAFNIRLFLSLIQSDGYNPLVIQGSTFTLDDGKAQELLSLSGEPGELQRLFSAHFTPGRLLDVIQRARLLIPDEDFFEQVLGAAEQHLQAVHGEGYWSDHWSYNLDLVEAYLWIYPEEKASVLFDTLLLPFYDNVYRVNPRRERFVLDGQEPRQFNVLSKDDEKETLINTRNKNPHWARTLQGKGDVFVQPLISKLTLLALLKFSTLDPSGFGIQMEAGKPGWYDALNGLPALFGSSMPDSYELLHLINFLVTALEEIKRPVNLPVEAVELCKSINKVLSDEPGPHEMWEGLSDALEIYRERTHLGFEGACEDLAMHRTLKVMRDKLESNLQQAEIAAGGLPPTYFIHRAVEYEKTGEVDAYGRPYIKVTRFEPKPLPAFLEGPVRRMRTLETGAALELYHKIQESSLFDQKLKMYRLNASLQAWTHEIGRARAFTPGWLENESIWLHMDFKYLLELLRAGLHDQFFAELKAHLPPFLDAGVYGRSPLENSSFIASSAHPDTTLHGNGFVARLSGSTAEFLSMWVMMVMGRQPFIHENGELQGQVSPILPGWLFDEKGKFSFRWLDVCEVSLHNAERLDTWKVNPQKVMLRGIDGQCFDFEGNRIPAPYAVWLREGKIVAMDVYFESLKHEA